MLVVIAVSLISYGLWALIRRSRGWKAAEPSLRGYIYGFAVFISMAIVIPIMVVFGLQSDTHSPAETTAAQAAPLPTSEPFTYGWARHRGQSATDAERMCKGIAHIANVLAETRDQQNLPTEEGRKAALFGAHVAALSDEDTLTDGSAGQLGEELTVRIINRVYDQPSVNPDKLAATEYMRCMQ